MSESTPLPPPPPDPVLTPLHEPPRRVLLVAALAAEANPLAARLDREGPPLLDGRLVTGRRGRREVGVLRCGVGPERAEDRTARALEAWPDPLVISTGTCGSLVDDLHPRWLVTARSLCGQPDPRLRTLPVVRPVHLHSAGEVVDRPGRRRALAAQGVQACEMEAAAVARAAGRRAVAVLKVVSDRAGARWDPVFVTRGVLPRSARMRLFAVRARLLVQLRLAPALFRWLDGARQ